MRYPAIMLDLETMGLSPSAPILAIGACFFDEAGEDTPETLQTFEKVISLASNEKAGRHPEAGTVIWWLQQSQAAQEAFLTRRTTNLAQALQSLHNWVHSLNPRPQTLWAKDPDFDAVILNDALRSQGLQPLVRYHQHRSVRTAMALAFRDSPPPRLTTSTAHSAVDDAVEQALQIQLAYLKLSNT